MPARRNIQLILSSLRRKARRQGVVVRSVAGPPRASFVRLIPSELKKWRQAAEELASAGFSFERARILKARQSKKRAYIAAYQSLLLSGVDFAADAIQLSGSIREELKESYEYIIKLGPGNHLRQHHVRKIKMIASRLSFPARKIFQIQLNRYSDAVKKWMKVMDERLLDRAIRVNSKKP